jgi:hypothetical protein
VTGAERLRAYLELSRVSNVPTVFSNAAAGVALGAFSQGGRPLTAMLAATAIAGTACGCLYIAGMALNDFVDRNVDRAERPHRPIPSGRISPEGALAFACSLLVIGVLLLLFLHVASALAGVALVGLIVLYDLIHSRTAASVFIMGACRGMTLVTAGRAFGYPPQELLVIAPAALLAAYVAGFSLIARHEVVTAAPKAIGCGQCGYPIAEAGSRCPECGFCGPARYLSRRPIYAKFLGAVPLLALVLPPQLVVGTTRGKDVMALVLIVALFAAICFLLAWTTAAARCIDRRPPKVGAAVTMWIAGISVIDAFYCILSGSLPLAAVCAIAFLVTRWGQRRIAGT